MTPNKMTTLSNPRIVELNFKEILSYSFKIILFLTTLFDGAPFLIT